MSRYLSQRAEFANTPALLGLIEYRSSSVESTVLGALFSFVRNQGDCWHVIVDGLERHLDSVHLLASDTPPPEPVSEAYVHPLDLPRIIGQRSAEMHKALKIETTDAAFAPEPITIDDIKRWVEGARREIDAAFAVLEQSRGQSGEGDAALVERLLAQRSAIDQYLDDLMQSPVSASKTRIHGDYHLGQILVAENDVFIIDFEGEPRRTLEERLAKTSPMRDIAGLLRSLDYATWAALDRVSIRTPQLSKRVREAAVSWRNWACATFLDAYGRAAEDASASPYETGEARALLDLFILQKAAYEISYEAANRPGWISIPVRGMLDLLAARDKVSDP
jgi:maltose alpha-D-glucosyltransferase/alpha-amylase